MGDPNPKPREPLTGRTWRQQLPGFRSAVFFAGASAFVFLGFGLTLAALTTRVTFVAEYTVTRRQPSPQGLDLAFVIVCKQPAMWTRVMSGGLMINVPCTLLESMVVLPGLLTDDDAPVSNISGIAHAELDGTWFMRPYVIPAVSPPQFTSLICVVTITIMSFVVGLLTLQQAHGQSLTPGGLSTCGHMSACCLASLNMLMAVLCLLYFAYRVFQCDEDELIAYSDPRNPLGQNCFDSCLHGGEGNNDGVCQDGGPGSATGICALGSDCSDCGIRHIPQTISCLQYEEVQASYPHILSLGPTSANPYPDKQMIAAGVFFTVAAVLCVASSYRSLDPYLCPCLVSPAVEGSGGQSSPTERTPLHDDKSTAASKQLANSLLAGEAAMLPDEHLDR